jgi:hypothetical protein
MSRIVTVILMHHRHKDTDLEGGEFSDWCIPLLAMFRKPTSGA